MLPDPLSPYAVAKLVGEYYCQVFTRVYGLETVSLRYFNVFGPRQDPGSQYSGVVSRFISALLSDEQPVILWRRRAVARLYLHRQRGRCKSQCCLSERGVGQSHQRRNGRAHHSESIASGAEGFDWKAGRDAEYLEPRVGDVRHSLADITMARELLGYESKVGSARRSSAHHRLVEVRVDLRESLDYVASFASPLLRASSNSSHTAVSPRLYQ